MLSIIWNITNKCPWNCDFCVMDAGTNCQREELTYSEKLTAISHLNGVDCRIDLSGGEVMLNRKEHLPFIAELSRAIGRDRLGISCSGAYIREKEADFLAEHISDIEMTMDTHPNRSFTHRPKDYHMVAGKAADLLVERGVRVGLQTVVTRDHLLAPELLDELHGWLCEHRISEWSLLCFFLSGRGANFPELALNYDENLSLVMRAKALCRRLDSPKLDIHYLMPGTEKNTKCRCVRKSIGILPDGRVTACFWGLDTNGNVSDNRFLLGNIVKTPLLGILNGENARYWSGYCGGCPLSEGDDKGVLIA